MLSSSTHEAQHATEEAGKASRVRGHLREGDLLVLTTYSESVRCRFSKCRFSAELEELENSRDGGQRRKKYPKSLGPAFSLCRRAGMDVAKAQFSFRRCPPPRRGPREDKIEQTIQTLRWSLAKVAFDIVRVITPLPSSTP